MFQMKKVVWIQVLLLICTFYSLQGQGAFRQAGLRAGYTGGLFFQSASPSGNADAGVIALLSFRTNGLQLTGMKIFYDNSLSEIIPDLFAGWGYGAHAGFITEYVTVYEKKDYYYKTERLCPLIGIDVWGTLEYRFREMPLAVSLNIKPFFEVGLPSFFRLMPADLGISVSYMF